MAEYTYASVLALCRVIERAGIHAHWVDFLRAYNLHDIGINSPHVVIGQSRSTAFERLRRLKEFGAEVAQFREANYKRFFERVTEAIYAELVEPGRDLLGLKSTFEREPDTATRDLEILSRELLSGGYVLDDAGKLVPLGTEPSEDEVDPVTGIGGRKFLNVESKRVFDECIKNNLPCAAVFCDIDNFKKFNEDHGHDVADKVLRAVAQVFNRALTLRGSATGRYGGEEMVATVRNMIEDEAAAAGERIRLEVGRQQVDGLSVGLSVGVASITKGSLDDLWRMADTALRRAKALGKNRTVKFSDISVAEKTA